MKKTKKLFSILLSCLMLMSLLSVSAFAAAGTQDNPINANDKWFGYGVDCFLMNTTLTAGDADGVWYRLTADAAGILHVEHSSTEVDYQLTVTVNGQEYLGYENGVYNKPVMTLPVAVGDVINIHLIAQDTTLGGLVYCNAKFITGENNINQIIKLKGANVKVWIANGATVYLQDDSLQGEYAAQGLKLQSSVEGNGITVISGNKNYTDTDGDGYVELKLGGSAGSAGAPAVKPSFAIRNESGQDAWFVLNVVANTAHECVYDNDADADCNTCGAIREIDTPAGCQHEYLFPCDATCMHCGELTNPDAAHLMNYVEAVVPTCATFGNIAYYTCAYCLDCWDNEQATGSILYESDILIPATEEHVYDNDVDAECNVCGRVRTIEILTFGGTSVSAEVNGLAIRVDAKVAGMQADGKIAVYENATVNGYKLITMGALASNNGALPSLENVNNNHILNIPAQYLCAFDTKTGAVSYSIRITDIPEEQKDTIIAFRPYYIYEDEQGAQQVIYGDVITASYNNP